MADRKPANHPDRYLGESWEPTGEQIPDPKMPLTPGQDTDDRQARHLAGYGYSDYC
jgi:hypothetical protein